MGMAETLRKLVGGELARRSEPWVRKFQDPATGAPYDDVVAALAQVGVGLERASAGNPLSDEAFREQLGAWLVDTVIVNPQLPKNAYRPQLQTGVRMQFETRAEPAPSARALDTLAELALGAYEETHPRAARIVGPAQVVDAYLDGADAVARLAVAPAAVTAARAAAALPRGARRRRPSARRGASGKAAKRAKPTRPKSRASAARGRTKHRATPRGTGRQGAAAVRRRTAKKSAARKSARKHVRAPGASGVRRRTAAGAKARRKKK